MADQKEELQDIFRLHLNDICGCHNDRDFSGWMITVCGVSLGIIKVWENPHEVEATGVVFEENDRLIQMVKNICRPRLRIV
jgi:hypothetical protein